MLARQETASLVVTVFGPRPLTAGLAHLSVLVQRRDDGEPLLDGAVTLGVVRKPGSGDPSSASPAHEDVRTVTPKDEAASMVTPTHGEAGRFPATQGAATNKLLRAATITFDSPGTWDLLVHVAHPLGDVTLEARLSVEPATSRLRSAAPVLALPPLAVLLFAANQLLKERSSRRSRE